MFSRVKMRKNAVGAVAWGEGGGGGFGGGGGGGVGCVRLSRLGFGRMM